jgi:hypothetical protein
MLWRNFKGKASSSGLQPEIEFKNEENAREETSGKSNGPTHRRENPDSGGVAR